VIGALNACTGQVSYLQEYLFTAFDARDSTASIAQESD